MPGERTFDAPYPDLAASQDSAVIARGRYLAFGAAHCVSCHAPMDKFEELENGLQMPLMGGWELEIPPGRFRAPNLTPDMETGIGKFTDGELARAMRYSVKHDGSPLFPFMPFQEISDEDLVAIISFLRSQEPIKNKIQPSEYSFLGRALRTFGAIKPETPKTNRQLGWP
ncbi:MAG: c-type cytochrome [Candidatus Marinimicrobia bacterium]|nr:c-type cytochrome [Candidatus Neomarinimicrobiota bacterium]